MSDLACEAGKSDGGGFAQWLTLHAPATSRCQVARMCLVSSNRLTEK